MKLGKLAPKHDPRTLHFGNYLRPDALPKIPAQKDWSGKVAFWRMLANDKLGDCTCAAAGHMLMDWSANASTEIVPTDTDIITAYSAVSGYDPQTGENDNGAVGLDVLNYWRKQGIANHQIYAYAALQPRNHSQIKAAVYLFGGVYIGLALPISAQNQTIWDVPPGGAHGNGRPGSWGGHAVNIVAFDAKSVTVVTWGSLKKATWQFLDHYMDEAYTVLSQDFINNGIAPNAIDWTALQTDLSSIAH